MKTVKIPAIDNLYFTSDTHFMHKRMVLSKWRPFDSLDEHDTALIDNWNSTVPKDGLIYHLGDTCFGKADDLIKIFSQLNGVKRLVRGNHDAKFRHECLLQIFEQVNSYVVLRVKEPDNFKRAVVLFHFPIESWYDMHHNSFHFHGHCHGNLKNYISMKRYDVGVDPNNLKPISYDKLLTELKDVPFVPVDHHEEQA